MLKDGNQSSCLPTLCAISVQWRDVFWGIKGQFKFCTSGKLKLNPLNHKILKGNLIYILVPESFSHNNILVVKVFGWILFHMAENKRLRKSQRIPTARTVDQQNWSLTILEAQQPRDIPPKCLVSKLELSPSSSSLLNSNRIPCAADYE